MNDYILLPKMGKYGVMGNEYISNRQLQNEDMCLFYYIRIQKLQ